MATSGGTSLAPKAIRAFKLLADKATRLLREKLPQAARALEAELEPAYVRNPIKQPVSRVQAIRQTQNRWYSTQKVAKDSVREFSSATRSGAAAERTLPSSRTGNAVKSYTGRAPFASTLRPNLTGGTLSRSAGGYTLGSGRVGGARYFSHTPAAQVQVVHNVSQAVRAFWLTGQRVQYDGTDPQTGNKRFKAVSKLQDKSHRRMQSSRPMAPGSYIDFKVSPTITAVGPLSALPRVKASSHQTTETLQSEGLMSNLAVDFARALKDLTAVTNDLNKLHALGDLPIVLVNESTLRVQFPGCDADTIESLCIELGISRGIVHQDEDFDTYTGTQMALLFPFAPSKTPSERTYSPMAKTRKAVYEKLDWQDMMVSPKRKVSPSYSNHSEISHDHDEIMHVEDNPWQTGSDYSSLHESDKEEIGAYFRPTSVKLSAAAASDYEGLEGIYRFLEECERAKR